MGVSSANLDIEKAREILKTLALPPEISAVRAEYGEDSSGSTALWIIVRLAAGAVAKRSDVKKITDFTGDVQTQLLHSGIELFPYVKLEDAA